MNADKLVKEIAALHPVVHDCFTQQRAAVHKSARQGEPTNFEDVDYVLVDRENFHVGEKLSLRCQSPV